tara:strand:- start:2585 stop:3454 length:870 start_codon:yes stop_codon:yes gene_type:complete
MNDLMNNIKNLREITGAGFLDCKKALSENNNDIDKSINFLRKKGLAKAVKKSSREANEGVIGVFSNDSSTVLLEINTETDFAAKNEIFLNFVEKIGKYLLNSSNEKLQKTDTFLNSDFDNKKISEHFTEIISKVGENIVLRRIKVFIKEEGIEIFSYTHNNYRNNIGKICAILVAKIKETNEDSKQLGKNLCMHIAASKPIALDISDLDTNLIDKEKEIQLATIKSSGKPENILNKILEGKMNKFYSDVTLLNQLYIFDTEKKVKEVIAEFSSKNKFSISDYELFILGS